MAETTVKQRAFAFIAFHFQSIGLSRFVYVAAIFSAVTTCRGFHLTVIAWLRIRPEYPVLFSMSSGEFCLRLKPYLVVKIASDVLTEHCCEVCVVAMMFCGPDCRLCAGMCGKWLRNQGNSSYQPTTCFGLLTLRRAKMGYEKYSLHLIFTFYLNRHTSVLKLFPVVVFH